METKKVTEDFALRGAGTWTSDEVRSTMETIERLFEDCDEALSSACMGTTGYEKQDIAAISDGMRYLIRYVCSANEQAYNELDHPLYKDFVNNATGALAKIKLDEITTENTFQMEVHNEILSAGYPRYVKDINRKLTLMDFMGITEVEAEGGIAVLENVDSVNWFKNMFRGEYEEQGLSRMEIREILKEYADNGEFFHKGYHPVKGFISGLLDVTIIKPAIEAVIGIDLITQEELTAFERGMQGVDALIGIVTLGQGAAAARTAGEGIFKTVFKTWATDAASDAMAYTVGNICDKNGVPIGISLIVSGLTGCTVSRASGKYFLTDEMSGTVTEYTAEEIQSLIKKADEMSGGGEEVLEKLAKNSEKIIESVKRESEALETAVKKGGVLGNAVAGKKALTEGVIAKAIGNIDGLTDAAKTGGKSIDATQQAVKGIKTADVTDVVKQVKAEETSLVKEILENKNLYGNRTEVNVEELEELVFGKGEYRYRIPIKEYSSLVNGMSTTDAKRYITNNEAIFFSEFSDRASVAGLNDKQIEEAFCTMRGGNYTKMASYFDTSSPVDGAVFWSGDKEAAATYANSIGGTVLEQTPGGQVFDNWRSLQGMYPEWDTKTNIDQMPIWKALSTQYAGGAAGKVTYIVPEWYNKPNSMWQMVEQPILESLQEEKIVTEITIIKE